KNEVEGILVISDQLTGQTNGQRENGPKVKRVAGSKDGKRFAFVRFIKVDNVDRLVGNLYTLWIGRMHLHANVVRFERTPSQVPRPSQPVRKATHTGNTFASAVKGNLVSPMSSSPALVLDDTCLEDRD
nr:RNA-directed DNA polymerase, eukaryota, nucleotide-binding alpha-beta plait domain protein [Tanacetum cinerariifolium]